MKADASCQDVKKYLSDSCSNTLDQLSYFWKLDSLGTNGSRFYSYDRLLKCKMDKITIKHLLEKLGKPNKVQEDNSGTYYCYYYFNGRKLPEEANMALECLYIFFKFNSNDPYAKYIGKDYFER